MEPTQQVSYHSKYRTLVERLQEAKRLYAAELPSLASNVLQAEDFPEIPYSASSPYQVKRYYEIREVFKSIQALENARTRLVKAIEYCLKTVNINQSLSVEEYRTKVLRFEHWRDETILNGPGQLPPSDPRIYGYIAEQVAVRLFDYSGGEFSGIQAEYCNDKLIIYLIK